MAVRIKICGITTCAEARLAIDLGADSLGFVGETNTGPCVTSNANIADIISSLDTTAVETVYLTASANAEQIADEIAQVRPYAVQMVAPLPVGEVQKLSVLNRDVKRILVVHVQGEETHEAIEYSRWVDAFLLDSGNPKDKFQFGGTGRTHDWAISDVFVQTSPAPVYLAGGLNAGNVGRAIRQVKPFGVDVCSGVFKDGSLDANRLREFIQTVRQASPLAGVVHNKGGLA